MAGAVVFYIGDTNKLIVPTEKYEGTDRCKNSASQWKEALVNKNFVYYPHFNPMIYSFEVFVPLVNFGQRAHWQPDDMGCKDSVVGSWSIFHIHVLRWWSWFEAGLGWIAVTLGAAGLTSIIRKSSANA